MPRIERLPDPPEVPARSPPASVVGETETLVPGLEGGPALQARLHVAPSASRVVVLCHPHPLYGGSMHSPVVLAVAKILAERRPDIAWARFDFRGVGASEGDYDAGRGEVDDARAVVAHVRRLAPAARMSVCGHSFGSWVGLRAAGREESVDRVLLVSPSVRFFEFHADALRFQGKKTIFFGDADEYSDLGEVRRLAAELGADLRVFQGFDHHFMKSRRTVAEAALPVLVPESPRP